MTLSLLRNPKVTVFYLSIFLLVFCVTAKAQVQVSATAATTGPAIYTTVKGAFDAINAGTHQGAINIVITANTAEVGTASLNASGSGSASYTSVNIKPQAGTNPVISGSVSGGPLVKLNGSRNVTIDGSNNGSTSRNLTITNTNTASSNVLQVGSVGTTPISNIVVKNSNLINGANSATAVLVGDAGVVGGPGYFNNITMQNNSVQKAYIGYYFYAVVAVNNGNNTLVTENDLDATGANAIRLVGIYAQGVDGITVSNNNVGNFESASSEFDRAIWFATGTKNSTITGNTVYNMSYTGTSSYAPIGLNISPGVTNANITIANNIIKNFGSTGTWTTMGIFSYSAASEITYSGNQISNIKNTNTSGYGAAGIVLANTIGAATKVYNNFIWDVAAYGYTNYTTNDNGNGIVVDGGGGYDINFNTIVLNTNATLTGGHKASCLLVTANVTATGAINLRNNILVNLQTIGNANSRFAISNLATSGSAVFSNINYNNYYTTSGNLSNTGTNASITNTMAQLQTSLGGNANSVNINPILSGANDLHLVTPQPLLIGTPIAGISTDIDGETRHATSPYIGADEYSNRITPDANGIVYVKKGATGNGPSWTYAASELADALKAAKTNTDIKQIWVAGGTYKPMYSPADNNFGNTDGRNNSFLLVKDVKVYGGFAGTETTLAQRDLSIVSNKSTLSGDIDANDVITDDLSTTINGNNSYHVLIAAGAMGTASLDGFTITGGNASTNSSITINSEIVAANSGGGLVNLNATLGLSNLKIAYNGASFSGAGIFNYKSATISINNTIIANNKVTGNGGGVFSDAFGSSLRLTNVQVAGNVATANGGGICDYSISGNSSFTNVLITGNTSGALGGGMYLSSATSLILNTTIAANTAVTGGGGLHNEFQSPLIYNSIVLGNNTGVNNNNSTPTIKNSLIQGLSSTADGNINATGVLPSSVFVSPLAAGLNSGGDYHLKSGSPAINSGNSTLFAGLDVNTKDLDNNLRLVGSNIDMGSYESALQSQTITVANISKTYGDTDFEPGATASSGLTVSYASADNNIAETYQDAADSNKWKLKIKKVGTVNITASQAGGNGYSAATDQVFVLTIQPRALTVTATGNNKIYDATNAATVTLASDALSGDVVSLAYTSATFSDENVANGKTVTVNGITLSGTSAANYTFNTTASTTGNITPFALTVSATGNNKVYDATNVATVTLSSNALAGNNIALVYTSATFNNKTVANGKTVSVVGISLSGTDAGNYTFNTTASTTANITPFALTVSAIGNNKIYNANNNATVNLSSNAFAGDNIALAYTSATFGNRAVANGKPVSVVGISLSGTDAANYTFNTTASTTANITPFALTVSATGTNRVYNATNTATVNLSSNAFVGDDIALAYTSATFNNENVANGKPVSVSGISLSGTDATNYTFNTTASTTANITPFALTVSATGTNKVYDATNNATVTLASNAFAGDNITLAYISATFGNKAVANGKPVSVSGISLSGTDAGNYTFNTTASTTANITPFALTISATGNSRTYNGSTDATVSLSHNGFSGDVIALNYTAASFDNRNVGSGKPVSVSGIALSGTDAGNYTFNTAATTTAAIAPATLNIVAQAKTKTYGDADPAFTYTSTGLMGTDAIGGSLGRNNGENVDSYPITQGSLSAGTNYTLTFTGANLTINRAALTVTAGNAARCLGQANPNFSLSYSGFKLSDNENSLTARPQAATIATASSVAGSYAITVSNGSSNNYTFVYVNGTLRVDALPNITIVPSRQGAIGRGLTLQLTATGGNSYSWANAQGIISGQNSATLTIRPTTNTTYTVTVTNANGCSSTASYAVVVADDLAILKATNLLTPNGDGVNDVWKVDNIDMYPQAVVRIFDKAGRIVYTRKGYDNNWDGTYNGQPLAEGTYYYIIDLEAGKVLRGYITLVRDR